MLFILISEIGNVAGKSFCFLCYIRVALEVVWESLGINLFPEKAVSASTNQE